MAGVFRLAAGRAVVAGNAATMPRVSGVRVVAAAPAMAQLRPMSTNRQKRRPGQGPKLQVKLLSSVDGLGDEGRVTSVARGYARNYLIPKGLAQIVVGKTIVNEEHEVVVPGDVMASKITAFLAKRPLTIKRQQGNAWQITPDVIAAQCKKQFRLEVPLERIQLATPVTSYGTHIVPVTVDDGHAAEINLHVIKR